MRNLKSVNVISRSKIYYTSSITINGKLLLRNVDRLTRMNRVEAYDGWCTVCGIVTITQKQVLR
jgi:hypothetical protein